jgi:hypothetical protein
MQQAGVGRGFVGGFIGALILAFIMLVMQGTGMGAPMFVGAYEATLGSAGGPVATWIVGAVLFAISGGLWGALYGVFVRESSITKGMIFGFLPALWLWLVVAPFILDKPIFFGFQPPKLLLPLVFNVVIWGGFLGWYCQGSDLAAPSFR